MSECLDVTMSCEPSFLSENINEETQKVVKNGHHRSITVGNISEYVINDTATELSSGKRKFVDTGFFCDRSAKHARTHFDFWEMDSMIFDEDQWQNGTRPLLPEDRKLIPVHDAEYIRDKILQELAFTQRQHMPRMPNQPIAVPLFNKNPLKVHGVPLAYRALPPLRSRRHAKAERKNKN